VPVRLVVLIGLADYKGQIQFNSRLSVASDSVCSLAGVEQAASAAAPMEIGLI
jgi:hypothetical protein